MNKVGVNSASVKKLAEVAATEATKFDATERSAFIRSHIDQIKAMIKSGHSVDDIKSVFPDFSEQYPNLLEMLLRPGGFDENSLSLMIRMLEKMGQGKASQHEASIQVGQHLLNSYVKPQLDQDQ